MRAHPIRIVATEGRYAGRPCWLFTDSGRLVPVVSGGDGSDDPPGDGQGGGDSGAGGGKGGEGEGGQTFTQADLDRIATREKAQGRRAAEDDIAKDLGVSLDEAKRILAEARERDEKQKTEAQRAKEAADAEKAAAEAAKAEAARERHEARVERALVAAGVSDDKRLGRLARLIEVEVGAELDDVKAAVADLHKEMPELFGAANGAGAGKGKGVSSETGGNAGSNNGRRSGEESEGKRRAKARWANRQRTTATT